ncbi:MAG TPA: FAD-dependent oxidoreductase [Sphaerochaeta sp.]|nr:FAD-dependent oxidoreductase [Sphaerochaeta sp.]
MNTAKHTPIIAEASHLVLGSSVAAVVAALQSAQAGHTTLLATSDTALLSDLTLTELFEVDHASPQLEPWYSLLFPVEVAGENSDEQVRRLYPRRIKTHIEALLERHQITLLYGAWPIGIDEQQELILFGSKGGIVAVRSSYFLDFSSPPPAAEQYSVLHIMGGPTEFTPFSLSDAPAAFSVHPGPFGAGHASLRVAVSDDSLAQRRLHSEALKCLIHLQRSDTRFTKARPGRFSAKLHSRHYCLKEEFLRGTAAVFIPTTSFQADHPSLEALRLSAYNRNIEILGYPTAQQQATLLRRVLVQSTCDVLVVGGGTAGAMAAIAAAQEGAKVILLEANTQLGGTATVGGVNAYWYGNRYHDVVDFESLVDTWYVELGLDRTAGPWGSQDISNPTIRTAALTDACQAAGVQIALSTFSVAVSREGNRIAAVFTVGEEGPVLYEPAVLIDATGDGDLALFGGAEVLYGAERDATTFWASLAQYPSPEAYQNNFSSMVLVDDLHESTRFIQHARTRGENMYDHGTYLAMRESRHIQAKKTLDLRDVLSWQTYEDTILTCFSNYDPKGVSQADIIHIGVLPPPMQIAIPLSALIPLDTEGIVIEDFLVIGKAFGVTHDAFPAVRMQPDLMHQGTVAGLAAAQCITKASPVSEIDLPVLQRKIREKTGDPLTVTKAPFFGIEAAVASLTAADEKEWTYLPFVEQIASQPAVIALAIAPSEAALPPLLDRWEQEIEYQTRLLLAQLLLWHGSDAGTNLILEAIAEELAASPADRVPPRRGSMLCVQLLPDHGVMAETTYLLNLLAYSEHPDSIAVFAEVVARLQRTERDYLDNSKAIYGYIAGCAFVAERRADPRFIPLLEALLALPEIQSATERLGSNDILVERLALLGLWLNRAIARCGGRSGYQGLIALLPVDVLALQAAALRELRTLTGLSFGLEAERWQRALDTERVQCTPVPIQKKTW